MKDKKIVTLLDNSGFYENQEIIIENSDNKNGGESNV